MSSTKYFNPVPLFILFRETIEASIVVSVLLTFLNRTAPQLKRQVWWGVGIGVCISLILAVIFAVVYYEAQNNLFQGKNQQIFNGCIFWVAAAFITFLAFAMLRYKGWEDKWARKMQEQATKKLAEQKALEAQEAADKEGTTAAEAAEAGHSRSASVSSQTTGQKEGAATLEMTLTSPLGTQMSGEDVAQSSSSSQPTRRVFSWWKRTKFAIAENLSNYTMFLVVFFTILREGLESVVFLFGVGNSSPEAIPISGLIGIFCGICVGFLLFYSGKQVKDIKWLLFVFATVLFFIAAGAFENGANLLMNAGLFGTYYVPAYPYVEPGTAIITKSLYGVEGAPPAPSTASLAAAGFSDGDEAPIVVSNTANDGYVYVMTHQQPWFQAYLWDISSVAGDSNDKNKFLALCKAIFGYNSQPTFIDVVFYLGYWIIVLALGLWKWHKGTLVDADWKHTKAMKVLEEEARAKAADLSAVDLTAADMAAAKTKLKSLDTTCSSSSERSPNRDSDEVKIEVVELVKQESLSPVKGSCVA